MRNFVKRFFYDHELHRQVYYGWREYRRAFVHLAGIALWFGFAMGFTVRHFL